MLNRLKENDFKKLISISTSDLSLDSISKTKILYDNIILSDKKQFVYANASIKLIDMFKSSSETFFDVDSIIKSSVSRDSITIKDWLFEKESISQERMDIQSSSSSIDLANAKSFDQSILKNIKKTLFELLSTDVFRVGFESSTSIYFRSVLETNPDYAKKAMLDVFYDNYHNKKYVEGILNVLSIMDYEKVTPEGPIMVLTLTSYESDTIKEALVRVFENWCNKESIRLLEKIRFDDPWLENYRLEVIEDIKEYN